MSLSAIDRIVVVNDLSFAKGGASLLAVQSARAFARRGFPVTLICGDGGDADLQGKGVDVVSLGQERLLDGHPLKIVLRGLDNPRTRAVVGDWVARNDTPGTIYHLHGWSQILSPSLFTALRPAMERMVMTVHDFFLICPNGAMFDYARAEPCPRRPMSGSCMMASCDRRGPLQKTWRLIRQSLQNRAIGAVCPPQLVIHPSMPALLAQAGLGDGDMALMPNPIDPLTDMRVPAELNRDVLFVGRIEDTKGIDLAAEACRRAGLRLVAAGDGELLGPMRQRYPEMEWLGRKSKRELPPLARRARMLVMPSRHMEPFGLSAVEALWSGIPTICSQHALIAPEIEAAGAGFSINPRDIDGFARTMLRLANDDQLTLRMSETARQATGHLALRPDAWIDRLLAAYSALVLGGREALLHTVREQGVPARVRQTQRSPSACASM